MAGIILSPGNPLFVSPAANLNPEQDALRWRAVIDRLNALEQQMKTTVRYNTSSPAGQEVVLPTIRGTNFNVSDGVRNRVQIGNLPDYVGPNGVDSPAQYGDRVLDASGNVISDSLGISQSAKNIAEVIQTSAVQGTNTSFLDVSGAVTPSFTLARKSNLLTMAMGRVAAQPAGSNTVATFLGLRCGPNTTSGAPGEVDNFPTVTFVPYCLFFFTTLNAGTYTAALQANTQPGSGSQWNVAYADVAVIQMGG